MTLDEKIGQMIQPDQGSLKDPSDIEKYFLGSLLSGGGSGPKNKEDYTLKGWTDLVDGYQKHALKTRLAIPLLYGVDAVHGHQQRPRRRCLPAPDRPRLHARRRPRGKGGARHGRGGPRHRHQLGLRAVRDRAAGRALGPDLRGLLRGPAARQGTRRGGGPRLPGREARPTRSRSWPAPSTSPATAARHSVRSSGTASPAWTRATRRCDEATLRKIHLPGYVSAVQAGVGTIMPSYSSWNGVKCSANKHLLTEILKQELGFEGFLISDYNAIDQIVAGLQEGRGDFDQRRHGHGDADRQVPRVLQGPEGAGGGGQGADVAHRRRRDAHPPRQVRARPDGQGPLAAGRPRPAKVLRLRRASAGGAAGGPRVAGAAQEREEDAAAGEDGRPHPRRRPRRRQPGNAVRRLDHRLAGQDGPRRPRRHDDPGRDQEHGVEGRQGDVLEGWQRGGGGRRRRRRDRRGALRRVPGRQRGFVAGRRRTWRRSPT